MHNVGKSGIRPASALLFVLLPIMFLPLQGCFLFPFVFTHEWDWEPDPPPDEPFEVYVVDSAGMPLEGVSICGGIDWDAFDIPTGSDGRAVISGDFEGRSACLIKDQHYAEQVVLCGGTFVLTPAPKVMRRIGPVTGKVVRFDEGRVVTLGYEGDYHVYSFGSGSVVQIASVKLDSSVRDFEFHGEILWCGAPDDKGVYVYSLHDPLNPELLGHLPIDGCITKLAVNGSCAAVHAYADGAYPLRVFSYDQDWNLTLEWELEDFRGDVHGFVSQYLIFTIQDFHATGGAGTGFSSYCAYDFSVPSSPMLSYFGFDNTCVWHGLFGNLYLTCNSFSPGEAVSYYGYEISDPDDIQTAVSFT